VYVSSLVNKKGLSRNKTTLSTTCCSGKHVFNGPIWWIIF